MRDKKIIEAEIDETEGKLIAAQREQKAWNSGKFKGSSKDKMSALLVESFENKLAELKKELSNLETT